MTGFLVSLVMVPIYLFFLLKERPAIPASAQLALKRRSRDRPFTDQQLRHRLLPRAIAGLPDRRHADWPGAHGAGSQFRAAHWNVGRASHHDSLHRHRRLLGASGVDRGRAVGRLVAPVLGHRDLIFFGLQNLEAIFLAPKIVDDSVGLHPMTVIVSIFVWGLLIGGLLGPILAVPLTATIKVLLARYVWGRRLREQVEEQIEDVLVVKAAQEEAIA